MWPDPRRYNNRTHRKLLIVDGKIGFIGGVGVDDLWTGNGGDPKHWRDNHYRITGPVVAQLQGLFMDNWLKTRGGVLEGPDYFPALTATGPYAAQAFKSSPELGDNEVRLMYLLAIASARKSLLIENAYFVPDEMIRGELIDAAKRGVDVEIVIPGKHIDQKYVRAASRRYWPELVRGGVKIYEFQPSMVHVKLMIVDDVFTSIGSANFDNRSTRLNDEANLNVFGSAFARQQRALFEADKWQSKQVTLDRKDRLVTDGVTDNVAGVVSPQL
jgi:cardiolipin synthase